MTAGLGTWMRSESVRKGGSKSRSACCRYTVIPQRVKHGMHAGLQGQGFSSFWSSVGRARHQQCEDYVQDKEVLQFLLAGAVVDNNVD